MMLAAAVGGRKLTSDPIVAGMPRLRRYNPRGTLHDMFQSSM
jgi:hypothetical protein